jgi:hypothetical protein
VDCKNEAEFRAYVVLLNLNDGNFLWEIKQLPAAVAKSPEVRFALDIYFAIENNNYVKFFQLLRRTSYMNACILLRYFNQVRCKALEIMVKAFASRAPVNFAISYFTDLLAFEDADNACLFLEYYGLACNRSEDSVTLDKRSFEFPDMPFILDRAMRVVESKRTKSTGEVICGSVLEPIAIINKHVVHSSFTREGYLKEDAWLAEDQNGKIQRPTSDVTDFRDSSARVTSPVVDEHVFKKPTISPPISPKTVLASNRSSIINRLGTRIEVPKEKPMIFGKPALEKISGITPIFSKVPDTTAKAPAIFSTPSSIFAPVPSAVPISVTPSIFGGSVTSKQPPAAESKNIFGSAFSTIVKSVVEPAPSVFKPSNSGSIFGGTQFISPTIGRDIFALPTASSSATPSSGPSIFGVSSQSISSSIFDSPALVGDEESLSDSGTESDKLIAAPSPKWSQDSDIEEEEEEEDDSYSRKQEEMDIRRKLEEKFEQEKKKLEADRISKISEVIFQQLLDEITKSETETITDDLMKQFKALQVSVYDDVLNDIILNEVLDVALEETVMKQVNLKMMRRHFHKWRANARESIDRMHKIENTPCWLPEKPMKEQVREFLHPSQVSFELNNITT